MQTETCYAIFRKRRDGSERSVLRGKEEPGGYIILPEKSGFDDSGERGGFMNRQEILEQLKVFPYDRNEYWVITGSAMVIYGIKEQAGDIDLGCSVKMADLLESDGYLYGRTKDGNRWFKVGEAIEIFESWLYDSVKTINGFQVISLSGLIEMKEKIGREKDFRDIKLIKPFLDEKKNLRSPLKSFSLTL